MCPKIRCDRWKRKYFGFTWEVNTPWEVVLLLLLVKHGCCGLWCPQSSSSSSMQCSNPSHSQGRAKGGPSSRGESEEPTLAFARKFCFWSWSPWEHQRFMDMLTCMISSLNLTIWVSQETIEHNKRCWLNVWFRGLNFLYIGENSKLWLNFF
jgi:hypothetical protein